MVSLVIRSRQDFVAGLLLIAIAAGALWLARDWDSGTLDAVGSGFFPRVVGLLLLLMGGLTVGRALLVHGPGVPGWAWRPTLMVTLAVSAFAVLLDRVGLVLAILAVVGIATFGGQPLRPKPLLTLWAGVAGVCVAIFVWGLGLPLRVWP